MSSSETENSGSQSSKKPSKKSWKVSLKSRDKNDQRTDEERALEKKIRRMQKRLKKKHSLKSLGEAFPHALEGGNFDWEQIKARTGERVRKKLLVKSPPVVLGWDKKTGEQEVGLPKYFENYLKHNGVGQVKDKARRKMGETLKMFSLLEYLFNLEPEVKGSDRTDMSIEDLYHREARVHMVSLLNECKRIESERQSFRVSHTLNSLAGAVIALRGLARVVFNGPPRVHLIVAPSLVLFNWLLDRQTDVQFPKSFIIILLSRLSELFWSFGALGLLKEEFIYSGLIDSVFEVMRNVGEKNLEACWATYALAMACIGCANLIEEVRELEGIEDVVEVLADDIYWRHWENNYGQCLLAILYGPDALPKGVKRFRFKIKDRVTAEPLHLVGYKVESKERKIRAKLRDKAKSKGRRRTRWNRDLKYRGKEVSETEESSGGETEELTSDSEAETVQESQDTSEEQLEDYVSTSEN